MKFLNRHQICQVISGVLFAGCATQAGLLEEAVFNADFGRNAEALNANGGRISPLTETVQYVRIPRLPGGDGWAATFDGMNSEIIWPAPESLSSGGDLTVQVRYREADTHGEFFLCGKFDPESQFLITLFNGVPLGQVSAFQRHYAGSLPRARTVPGRFYDVFLKYRSGTDPQQSELVTLVFDSQTGQEVGRSPWWPSAYKKLFSADAPLRLGRGGRYAPFAGDVDYLRIWDRALTDDEIYSLAACDRETPDDERAVLTDRQKLAAKRWREWKATWTDIPRVAWSYFQRYDGSPEEYARYREAGLNLVMAPLGSEQQAADAGLRTLIGLWGDDNRYAELYKKPEELNRYLEYADTHENSVSGILLTDEPRNEEMMKCLGPATAAVLEHLRNVPLVPLVNLLAYPANIGGGYADYLDTYLKYSDPCILLSDSYVMFKNNVTDQERFYITQEMVSSRARRRGIGYMGFVLVTDHGPYRRAGDADIRWQAYSLLAYGAQGLWYYNWRIGDNGFSDGIVRDKDDAPTDLYPLVQRVNREVEALSPDLLGSVCSSTYHVHNRSQDVPLLSSRYENGDVKEIVSLNGDDWLIGHLKSEKHPEQVLLIAVNKMLTSENRLELVLQDRLQVERFDMKTLKFVPSAGTVSAVVPAGDALILRVREK